MRISQGPARGILMLLIVAGIMIVGLMALEGKFTPRIPAVDKIAYVSDREGTPAIWMMNLDGSEPELLTSRSSSDSSPSWSADGTGIVFSSEREGLAQVFYMQPMREKGEPRQLTVGTGVKLSPMLSPDGRIVCYIQQGRVYTVNLDGSQVEPVLPPVEGAVGMEGVDPDIKSPYIEVDWSPDGRSLAAVRQLDHFQTARVLLGFDEDSQDITDLENRILSANRVSVEWAPEGKTVAVSLAAGNEGALVTRDYDNDDFTVVVSGVAVGRLAWSPSGDKIAFEVLKYREGKSYANIGLAVADVESGRYEIIVRGEVTGPEWSPDGSRIIFTRADADKYRDIWSVESDGSNARNLTNGRGDNYDAAVSPAMAR